MNHLSQIPAFVWRLLFAAALVAVLLMTEARAAENNSSTQPVTAPQANSWIFARSRYSHDPDTGVRVAQYAMTPPVEALPDPRKITSIYSRTRSVLRGADGSTDTYYRIRSSGSGRGGLDAEWERFHDAWRGARASGGSYQGYGYGLGGGYGGAYGGGFGGAYGGGGYGAGGYGGGGYGAGGSGYGGYGRNRGAIPRNNGFGPGYGRPDAGYLDPDASDGYRDLRPRTPNRRFFDPGFGTEKKHPPGHSR